jgi:BirA family transcriptional regulator, biotin operon repressor / biotin---[acetyl-CoA-carboxylase] ligase
MHIVQRHFKCIPSTNSWVKEHIAEFDSGTFQVVTAQKQSCGRGRDGRSFVSPKGGLYMTCAFEMPLSHAVAAPLSIALGAMIAQTLEIEFKWPNDLVHERKKIGGLLIEAVKGWWIVGLGANITTASEHLSSVKEALPTSLKEVGRRIDVETAACKVKEVIYETCTRFLEEGLAPFIEVVRSKLCCHKGETLWVRMGRDEKVEGIYEGVDDEGRLLISLKDTEGHSKVQALSQAEVFFE